jgi:hypothetical protein
MFKSEWNTVTEESTEIAACTYIRYILNVDNDYLFGKYLTIGNCSKWGPNFFRPINRAQSTITKQNTTKTLW